MNRIALVTDDLDVERRLMQALGSERYGSIVSTHPALCAAPTELAAQVLGSTAADVAILAPRMDAMSALAVAEVLDRDRPDLAIVVMAERSPEIWELAMGVGVRSLLPLDVDPVRLRDEIDRALDLADRRRAVAMPHPDTRTQVPAPAAPVPEASSRRHRLITVLAPKGGSGKTTISTNLAAGLARYAPEGVALVDLDLQFGDVADALRLDPERSLGDIRGRADQLDSAELKLLLASHPSGLYALCSPEDPAIGEEVRPEDVRAALTVLSDDMPFVVVDTAAGIDEAALTAIEMSTDLVLVASNDVPSIRNLRKLVDALDRLGITGPIRHLVLNRAGSKVGISLADVQTTLGCDIAVSIPSSRDITLSVNHGEPIVVSGPRSTLAKPFYDLVGRFTDIPAARSGGFARFKRSAR